MAKRPVNNPLALAVLTFLVTKPMYPYEMASALRKSGKEQTIKINWGSLYTVMQNLEKHGFVEEAGTTREGGRPERTAYAITDTGRAEMRDWLRELLSTPQAEYPLFATALSLALALPPDEALGMLRQRLTVLDAEIAGQESELEKWLPTVGRLLLVENEYLIAMRRAEATWVRALLQDIEDGAMPEIEQWRAFHETGAMPEGMADLLSNLTEEETPEP
jgi:DNA-binding PadR family transcriptional regulator